MPSGGTVIRFENVSFEYSHIKPILDEVSFNVRAGSKITLMGQNGAGKSTIFSLITGAASPEEGDIHIASKATIAESRQVIPREQMDMTVREFFQSCFKETVYDIDPKIDAVLETVHLQAPHDRIIRSFSGGQQARLLLASALIQNPDILLLDEPTNNLDREGIQHVTDFIKAYKKTVIVISHDAEFLNAFTDGVLYLDARTRKVEQYVGNYDDVVREISARIEKENIKNARLGKQIQAKKDQANKFAMKGGNLRLVAKRMRTLAEELEDEQVDVRKEDKTIRPFTIPSQPEITGEVARITEFTVMRNGKPTRRTADISLKRKDRLLLKGPNGIGKSTLLEAILHGKGATVTEGIRVGYYRQDFSMLDFEQSALESLFEVAERRDEQLVRSVAASFLITSDIINTKIGKLSEGQKGLVAFARLVLQKPGLLIMDEPTNHINFRHIPVIAEALAAYQGAMILVSHVPEFVEKVHVTDILDLSK